MAGSASGVCLAALWNSTMEPGCTFSVTRLTIWSAGRSFQSRLSLLETEENRWGARGCVRLLAKI